MTLAFFKEDFKHKLRTQPGLEKVPSLALVTMVI